MFSEDAYDFERSRLVTVRVKVCDHALAEEQHTSLLEPQPQAPDKKALQEDGTVYVVAKSHKTRNKAVVVTVPRAVALAAARVDPNLRTVRVHMRKPR